MDSAVSAFLSRLENAYVTSRPVPRCSSKASCSDRLAGEQAGLHDLSRRRGESALCDEKEERDNHHGQKTKYREFVVAIDALPSYAESAHRQLNRIVATTQSYAALAIAKGLASFQSA
jgi:hypothetical protein